MARRRYFNDGGERRTFNVDGREIVLPVIGEDLGSKGGAPTALLVSRSVQANTPELLHADEVLSLAGLQRYEYNELYRFVRFGLATSFIVVGAKKRRYYLVHDTDRFRAALAAFTTTRTVPRSLRAAPQESR